MEKDGVDERWMEVGAGRNTMRDYKKDWKMSGEWEEDREEEEGGEVGVVETDRSH